MSGRRFKLGVVSAATLRAAQTARDAMRPVRDAMAAIQPSLRPPQLSTSVPQLSELLEQCRAVESRSLTAVMAADAVWVSLLHDLGIDKTGTEQVLVQEKAAEVLDAQLAHAEGLEAVDSIRRTLGLDLLLTVSKAGVLSEQEALEIGGLLQALITDSIPYYGTIERVLRMLQIADLESTWMSLATPARQELALSAVRRAVLQSRVALDYVRLTFEVLIEASQDNDARNEA